ncbi:MAG: hypothetical protein ACREO5_12395 [Candidatus Binatia bacterium]
MPELEALPSPCWYSAERGSTIGLMRVPSMLSPPLEIPPVDCHRIEINFDTFEEGRASVIY